MKEIKQIAKKVKNLFARKKSVYGSNIFTHRDWLSRKVEDEMWKRNRFNY